MWLLLFVIMEWRDSFYDAYSSLVCQRLPAYMISVSDEVMCFTVKAAGVLIHVFSRMTSCV